VLLVAGHVAQATLGAPAQIGGQIQRRRMLALLVLPQNLPHQRGFRLPGAFGLSLQPDQQTLGQFHRQRFHARHGNTGLAGCRYRLVPADGRLGWRHDGREGKRIWTGFEADHDWLSDSGLLGMAAVSIVRTR